MTVLAFINCHLIVFFWWTACLNLYLVENYNFFGLATVRTVLEAFYTVSACMHDYTLIAC